MILELTALNIKAIIFPLLELFYHRNTQWYFGGFSLMKSFKVNYNGLHINSNRVLAKRLLINMSNPCILH